MHSPRRRKDVWDEDQSLLNILSQPSSHRYVDLKVTELRITQQMKSAGATFELQCASLCDLSCRPTLPLASTISLCMDLTT